MVNQDQVKQITDIVLEEGKIGVIDRNILNAAIIDILIYARPGFVLTIEVNNENCDISGKHI